MSLLWQSQWNEITHKGETASCCIEIAFKERCSRVGRCVCNSLSILLSGSEMDLAEGDSPRAVRPPNTERLFIPANTLRRRCVSGGSALPPPPAPRSKTHTYAYNWFRSVIRQKVQNRFTKQIYTQTTQSTFNQNIILPKKLIILIKQNLSRCTVYITNQ